MYYQFTGQPGHGKTVLALEFALEMKRKADEAHARDPAKHPLRELYVCNVRDFNAGKAGAIELTPEQVRQWHVLPEFDHAIIVIDEAYEHGMFPKLGPGSTVPEHVKQVAKHRHRGIDFVMICQSPTRQMHDFLHDLIEEHYHVRRRFGLPLANVKRWDRFERNPDKADPLTTTKRRYPKHIFKLYTSTKYDTSERRIPWFYWAFGAGLIAIAVGIFYNVQRFRDRFGGESHVALAQEPANVGGRANGAPATVAPAAASSGKSRGTTADYVDAFMPRIPSQPWTAPAYDGSALSPEAPRLFCMKSGAGEGANGESRGMSCSCLTEQGTRYHLGWQDCIRVAENGQYEPYLQPRNDERPNDHKAESGPASDQALNGTVIAGDPAKVVGAGTVL